MSAVAFDTKRLVGQSKEDAIECITDLGMQYRIVSEDGKAFIFPMILWVGVSLSVENGVVTSVKYNGK